MDLIKRYGRRGSFGPHGMFFLRLSNELLIRLYGLYNKEVVKLQGGFLFGLFQKRLVTLWGNAPMRPLEVQLPSQTKENCRY